MAVVINPESGEAVEVAPELVKQHNIPLYGPDGTAVSVPFSEAQQLIQQGYSQPTPEENKAMLEHTQYSQPLEKAKTFAEGAVSGATLGLGTALLPSDKESLRKRQEINPYTSMAGEMAGLIGGAVAAPGFSAVKAMDVAGTAAAKALGAEAAATALGRVGGTAVKMGVENALFETGHEVSKYIAGNPDSIETAAAHVGMAALLGAGLGTIGKGTSELWKLGPGAKIADALNTIKNRTSNIEHAVEVPESLQAMASGDNWAQKSVQLMNESDTMAGRAVQKDVDTLFTNLNEGVAETVGKTPQDIEALAMRRESELGEVAKEQLEKKIRAEYEPIAKKYNDFDAKFSTVPISKDTAQQLENTISDLAIAQGYIKSPSSPQMALIQRVLKEIPLQENAADLANYVKNMTYNAETWPAQKLIKQAIEEAKNGAIETHLKVNAPTILEDFKITQQEYKQMKETIGSLNDRLRTGKQRGVESFLKNVNESTPEDILHALSAKGDSQYQQLLQDKFPELAALSKDQELVKLLKKAPGKNGQIVDGKKLIKLVNDLPVESREFLIGQDAMKRLNEIGKLYETIPKSMNPSGTAKTLNALNKGFGDSALGMAVGAMSGSGIAGLMAAFGKGALKEGSDAVRLAALKFLASGEKVSAEGFVAAAKLADSVIKGEQKLNKVVGSVFSGKDSNVIEFPSAKERDMLKKQINESLQDPEKLMSVGGQTGHYMPDHGAAIGNMAIRNLGYLATLRPNTDALGVLDKTRVASSTEDAKYNRALDIAQQPLIIIDAIKKGELTMSDMQHMKTMYPELSNRVSEKLTAELMEHISKGGSVPYKTKLALSVWAHQPLDSSISQQSIMSNQMTFAPTAPQQASMVGTPAKANAALNKIGAQNMTLQQSRVNYKTTGHR
jgi:hypothetical protein